MSATNITNRVEKKVPEADKNMPKRILSVDALRGFVMFWIIGGGVLVIGSIKFFADPAPEWFTYHSEHVDWIGFSAWDLIMPLFLFVVGVVIPFSFSKHLWTSSMVLWAGGWSYLFLAVFYLVFDVWGFRKLAFPMVVIGANAIAVYMTVNVFDFREIGDIFVGGLTPHLGDYACGVRHLAAFIVIWLILLFLYRKKTFIRV